MNSMKRSAHWTTPRLLAPLYTFGWLLLMIFLNLGCQDKFCKAIPRPNLIHLVFALNPQLEPLRLP